ncbi:MAG: hypothetical protein P8Y63_09320 [Deltaproteobacteria bacterium]|jgi:hypothetical protein
MRKSTTLLGIVSLALFLVAGAAVLAIAARNSTLDGEGRQFVAAAIPAIFTHWDERELISRASPELQHAVNDWELDRLFSGMSRKLGGLQSCERVDGNTSISMETGGIVISGEYVAKTEFAAGSADIRLSLIRKSGNWQILSFRLNSDLF